jgi:hypothetical protein
MIIPCLVLMGLMLLSLTGASFAQPGEIAEEDTVSKDLAHEDVEQVEPFHDEDGRIDEFSPPVKIFYIAHGFAIKSTEYHLFWLNIESIRSLDPTHVRMLLSSNTSLEEIRNAVDKNDGNATYRGAIKLGERIYPLVNIMITYTKNSTTVNSAVAEPYIGPAPGNGLVIVGNLSIAVNPSEGGVSGEGELTINSSQQVGGYKLLIDMQPPLSKMAGLCKEEPFRA